jgi:superfamily II DNA or RNA helicase
MSRLRPFQQGIKAAVFQHWNEGRRNVLVKSPTGSGKTVITADIVRDMNCAVASIAHRSELVTQKSVALAREGIPHRVIGPDSLRKDCVTLHMEEFGRSFYNPGARVGVCSVDTLVGRKNDPWFHQVGLWDMDEAHHVLRSNKWGAACAMFPNAYGLGVTATPARADGCGLGAHADGVFEGIVQGPELRELIDAGYLTDYRVFAPPSDVDYSEVTITASGDYSPAKLRAAVHASDKIVGDVVKHYLRIAPGKLGVTFAVDIESAKEICAAYRAAGVPAEIVSAKTPAMLRSQILRRFKARQVLQLVNVDLFGEGFDLPAIEVVSMVRKTESWPLFVQQFGRALRLLIPKELSEIWGTFTDEQRRAHIAASEKPVALIIDHVGNVIRHGLPDAPRQDTLDRRERRSSGPSDAVPLRACANENADGMGTPCASIYPRFLKTCPYCGFYPEPPERSAPEFVEGDLHELTPEALAALRGKVAQIDGAPRIPQHLDAMAARGLMNRHHERQVAQHALREQIALWAGWQRHQGRDDSQSYRIFWHTFGIDVMSAQALGRPDAEALTLKIQTVLNKHGVIPA